MNGGGACRKDGGVELCEVNEVCDACAASRLLFLGDSKSSRRSAFAKERTKS